MVSALWIETRTKHGCVHEEINAPAPAPAAGPAAAAKKGGAAVDITKNPQYIAQLAQYQQQFQQPSAPPVQAQQQQHFQHHPQQAPQQQAPPLVLQP